MVECVSLRILRATIPVASIFLYATTALAQVDVRTARDVAVTPAGEVWTITADGAANGAIQRFTSGGMVTLPGGATRIAIGPRGGAWVVNAGGDLYHWEKGPEGYEIWKLYSLKAKDVGVGANGWVWAIASDGSIMQYAGGQWRAIPGGAERIAVDPHGNPWVTNGDHVIYQWTGSAWHELPGRAQDVAIAPNGTAYVLGIDPTPGGFRVYRWEGTNWNAFPGAAGVAITQVLIIPAKS